MFLALCRRSWCDSNGCSFVSLQDVKLSAEVEPFIPQKKGLEGTLVSMSLSGEAGGGGGSGGIGGGGGGGGGGGVNPLIQMVGQYDS